MVKAFIENNLANIRRAEDVASKLGLKYETLRKSFRRREMMTIGRYITLRRVERAKRLLLERPDLYCYHVCDEVGFSNEIQGEKCFKALTNMTMREYRKKYMS
jgi:two-component system response regulator YesN